FSQQEHRQSLIFKDDLLLYIQFSSQNSIFSSPSTAITHTEISSCSGHPTSTADLQRNAMMAFSQEKTQKLSTRCEAHRRRRNPTCANCNPVTDGHTMERRLDAAARKVAAMERENQMALARCAQFVQQHKQSTVQALGGPGKQNKEADMKKQMSMVVETGGRRQLKEAKASSFASSKAAPLFTPPTMAHSHASAMSPTAS
ncbi:hypothetical protein IWZ01DRAFT_562031, partial [Phyllosticta capitalensis]